MIVALTLIVLAAVVACAGFGLTLDEDDPPP